MDKMNEKWSSREEQKSHFGNVSTQRELLYRGPKDQYRDCIPLNRDRQEKGSTFCGHSKLCGNYSFAIIALGAAISMMLEAPEDGLDQEIFSDHLSQVGQLLTKIFYQHSIARKSFISSLLKKSLKSTQDTTSSDEWLYSEKFRYLVKEAKTIEKAVVELKQPEKTYKPQTFPRKQGNLKYPPANWKQVGNYYRRPMLRFKPRNQRYQTKPPQRNPAPWTTNHTSSKK